MNYGHHSVSTMKGLTVTLFLLLLTLVEGQNCSTKILSTPPTGQSNITPVLNKRHVALLMLLGFGGISGLIAVLYNAIRRHIFQDKNTLDAAFDAGGNVSVCLTAVTVASQTIWPGDLLQAATLGSKIGVSSLYVAQSFVISITLFPLVTFSFKSKAPGAKTYLQVVYARFGKPAHILFCCVACITSLFTLLSLIVTGKAVFDVLVVDASDELVVLILAVLCGSYCCIGGLGSTFYISYFNTALMFISTLIFVVTIRFSGNNKKYTNNEAIYEAMSCLKGPPGNEDDSLLTFRSRFGGIYGIATIFGVFGTSICDQAYWQSRIATTPNKGMLGFFLAVFVWFSLLPTLGITAFSTYLSMNYQNGTHMLNSLEVDSGYILPFVYESVLGTSGGYLMLTTITMALMSTGSGEVMALASIVVYDIYKTYINPFRKNHDFTQCILCDKTKISTLDEDRCRCTSSTNCSACKEDVEVRDSKSTKYGIIYKCTVHGQYRHYEDVLMHYRDWCVVFLAIGFVPFGMIILSANVTLNWIMMYTVSLFIPFAVPILLTVTWSKLTSSAVIIGSFAGLVANVASTFIVAATYYGDSGLQNFQVSTAEEFSLLASYLSGFVISLFVTVLVSVCNKNFKNIDPEKVWMRTMAIDNPLRPWRNAYKVELQKHSVDYAITSQTMSKIFALSRKVSLIGGGLMIFFFAGIISAVMLSVGTFSTDNFSWFVNFFQIWCMVMTFLVIVSAPVEEGIYIWRKHVSNRRGKTQNYKNDVFDSQTLV